MCISKVQACTKHKQNLQVLYNLERGKTKQFRAVIGVGITMCESSQQTTTVMGTDQHLKKKVDPLGVLLASINRTSNLQHV